ncbi:MAG TPA: PaaI family thioesterase [Bryobacteraceae bacterium]
MAFEDDLGISVTRKHKDGVTCAVPLRPALLNSNGVLHGGIIASIADEVAWHAILSQMPEPRPAMTTSELKVNYLRPIALASKTTARGYVLKLGKMLAVTRVDVFDSQKKLAAHATVTYAFLR